MLCMLAGIFLLGVDIAIATGAQITWHAWVLFILGMSLYTIKNIFE